MTGEPVASPMVTPARNSGDPGEVEGLVALGRALSDPIRVRMLAMISVGRGCCDLPPSAAPVRSADDGICACEFVEYFGIPQSRVSYHLGKLKAASLVREERRGKWSFYSLDAPVAQQRLSQAGEYLLPRSESGNRP